MALHAKIDTHFASLFARSIEKLRTSPDGDGSVLDHSLIVFGAGMSDGQAPLRLSVAARGDWRCREEDARKSLPRCEGVDACRQLLA